MKFKIEHIIIGVLVVILIFSMRSCSNKQASLTETRDLISAMDDTLSVYRNKDNQQIATISVLETANIKTFTELENLSGELKELQDLVKENAKQLKKQGSATIIKGETKIIETVITKVIPGDTITEEGFIYVYPQYLFDFNKDSWVEVSGVATRDTTVVDLKIRNEYTVVIGKDKEGIFKASKPFVEVTNKNPYSETTSLRTYQVSLPKPKKFGIGPSVGYGVSFGLDGKVQHGPQIGIGLNYNLIRF